MLELQDPETQNLIARWVGVATGVVMAFLGLQKWWSLRQQRRKVELDARINSKANLKEVEEIHERITRHKKATDEQVERNYKAIIDLYGKHETTQNKILEAEKRSSDRFEALMEAIMKVGK